MNKKIIALIICISFLVGCQDIVGNDRDSHGCIPSAGYNWCPSSEKCQRIWEEYCPEFADQYVDDYLKCEEVGGEIMESYPRQCRFKDRTYTEELENIQ